MTCYFGGFRLLSSCGNETKEHQMLAGMGFRFLLDYLELQIKVK
jgi:hypothetical protein